MPTARETRASAAHATRGLHAGRARLRPAGGQGCRQRDAPARRVRATANLERHIRRRLGRPKHTAVAPGAAGLRVRRVSLSWRTPRPDRKRPSPVHRSPTPAARAALSRDDAEREHVGAELTAEDDRALRRRREGGRARDRRARDRDGLRPRETVPAVEDHGGHDCGHRNAGDCSENERELQRARARDPGHLTGLHDFDCSQWPPDRLYDRFCD